MIGAMIMLHGDDKGLVLPPRVAPVQVVIIPIPYKNTETELVEARAKGIHEELRNNGIAAVLDDRAEYTPGWKFNEWELKGVPIRIEIGPRDVRQKQVILVRRDTSEKTPSKEEDITATVTKLLEEIQGNLFRRARKFLEENTTTVKDYHKFEETLKNKGGFIRASWCSNPTCEERIKQETGATIRLIPIEKEKPFSKCLCCEGEAKEVVYFARAY
jgi:prolyl-tRNA synthetase